MNAKILHSDFPCLTLIGMSGVGKTHLSRILSEKAHYYHFSVDYLIGAYYLREQIPATATITKENIEALGQFQGMIGPKHEGGLPLREYEKRRLQYYSAETLATLAMPVFVDIAKAEGFKGFINDTSGSFCKLDESIPSHIADHSLIVYIKASEADEKAIFERIKQSPKPTYYPPEFLDNLLEEFLKEKGLKNSDDIHPAEFHDFSFARVFEDRLPDYQKIADAHGVTISSDDVKSLNNAEEFIDLLSKKIQ